MNFKTPKTLRDVCEMQKFLDKKINESKGKNVKTRSFEQIKLSLIAEIIEFQEELGETHKTWKDKDTDRGKMLEECVDILFFISQLINYYNLEEFMKFVRYDGGKDRREINEIVLDLISNTTEGDLYMTLSNYSAICNVVGFKKEDIMSEYYRKWNVNLERIEGEWK